MSPACRRRTSTVLIACAVCVSLLVTTGRSAGAQQPERRPAARVPAVGRVRVLHEDSARRLWFEIGDPPRVQHYIDVGDGPVTCSGLLEIRAATSLSAEDTNRIIDSIGPAPARWPPDR